ncbi:chemotaxis protein CheW [Geotalea sp. SG265]|uniref:chemotaxis protein CheW n=1 Tax=Geotalea sp. SG265 TaxID=2922867 RepID=UPI001FAF18CD|nr:chemotaxis protein CheW [Geotalea sp. SG265]
MTKKNGTDEIRAILEEMREEYWQGLAEVEEVREEEQEFITVTLGGETFAFETGYASEVIRVPKLVKIPRVQELLTGVFNLRGEITAAIDIRPLLGLPQLPLTPLSRIVVVKAAPFVTGIIAEKVEGVRPLPMNAIEPAVTSLDEKQREYIRGQLHVDGMLIMMLDMAKLLQAPDIVVNNHV